MIREGILLSLIVIFFAFSYVFMTYLDWLLSVLLQTFADLQSVQKRVSIWYLMSALLVAMVFFGWRYPGQVKARLQQCLSPTIWWHKSAQTDYIVFLINRFLMALLTPRLPSSVLLTTWVYYQCQSFMLEMSPIRLSTSLVVALFTVSYFLLDDFSRFYLHRLLHKWPILWAFHRVHHSAKVLTPMTVFRTHPVEGMLFFLRASLVQAVCIGVFVVLFPDQVSLYTVWGVSIFTFLFNLFGANLRHSPVVLSYGKWEKWLISPAQHQRHHSSNIEDYDCNFGVVLAVWDRMLGSWKQASSDQTLSFGTNTPFDQHRLVGLYLIPCYQVLMSLMITGKRIVHRFHWVILSVASLLYAA